MDEGDETEQMDEKEEKEEVDEGVEERNTQISLRLSSTNCGSELLALKVPSSSSRCQASSSSSSSPS